MNRLNFRLFMLLACGCLANQQSRSQVIVESPGKTVSPKPIFRTTDKKTRLVFTAKEGLDKYLTGQIDQKYLKSLTVKVLAVLLVDETGQAHCQDIILPSLTQMQPAQKAAVQTMARQLCHIIDQMPKWKIIYPDRTTKSYLLSFFMTLNSKGTATTDYKP